MKVSGYGCVRLLLLLAVILCAFAYPAFADYTVTGKFQYEDRVLSVNGFTGAVVPRPIRFADVAIIKAADSSVLVRARTDANGDYSIVVPGTTQQQVRAVCAAASTQSSDLKLQVVSSYSSTSFGSPWAAASNAISYSGGSTLAMGTSTARSDSEEARAFNIWDVLVDGVEFVAAVRGSNPGTLFTAAWSSSLQYFGAYYDPARKFAYIGPRQAQDDPIIYQQFGHFIADLYSKVDGPVAFPRLSSDEEDVRLAYSEGLSLFLGASIRKFKGYPRPDFFILTDGSTPLLSFDLENLGTYIHPQFNYPPFKAMKGDTSIVAVAAALWDLTDGSSTDDATPGSDDDSLQKDFADVWKVLDNISKQSYQGVTIERFWDSWFSADVNNGSAGEMQSIFVNQGIEFVADSREQDNSPDKAADIVTAQLPSAAGGAKVLINEISLEDGGAIELYNGGSTEANLEGWLVQMTRGNTTLTAALPAVRIQPGQFLTIGGDTSKTGRNRVILSGTIPWQAGQDGACALIDKSNTPLDFVRWGSSRYFPPSGTYFTGSAAPTPDPGTNVGRNYAARDTDASSDWAVQSPSLGTYNLSGEQVHHTFYPAGDLDHATLNARSGAWYLVEAFANGNAADTVLEILSGDGTSVLAANDDSSLGAGSQIAWKAPSDGKFLIRAKRYNGPTNYAQYGSYDLRVIESSLPYAIGQPVTLTVSKPGQGGRYGTIAEAVADAYSGDIVEIIDSGVYEENVVIQGKSITLRAQRGKTPVIDGRGKNQGTLYLSGKNVRVEALTLLGGTYGIAVLGGEAAIVNSVVARAAEGPFADGIDVSGDGVTASIVHCTLVNNNRLGLGVFNKAHAKLVNSIVHGNQTDICEPDSEGKCLAAGTAGAGLTVRNTLSVKSTYPGSNGNINLDPKFADAASNNYHLQSGSNAIDKADWDAGGQDEPLRDADGLGRSLVGSGTLAVPDMGAFEYLNPNIFTASAVFPQIATGGDPEYRTSIVAVNTGTATATVRVSLTQSNGNPFNVTLLNAPAPPAEGRFNFSQEGSSFDASVVPSGTLRLETSGSSNLVSGYARLLSNLPLNGTALFKMIQGGQIKSEAGVGLSEPSRSFAVYIDNKNNAQSGYALANSGSATAGITMTLRDAAGNVVGSPRTTSLAAGHHIATFASQDFPSGAGADFEGMIQFSSDQPISAVALRYDNTNLGSANQAFSTIPVLLQGSASTALYFPQVADGGSYRTNFVLVNPGGEAATAHLEFYGNDGKPLGLPIGGSAKTSHDVTVPANGVARILTDGSAQGISVGWVKVTSSAAIGGSAIFQTLNENAITSEAGVASSPLSARSIVYVETIASAFSGLALSNPNESAVDVTMKLRSSSGIQIDTYTVSLPAHGHIAGFFTQWFGNYPDFEGTLEVVGSGPVSAVALRYDGSIFATLPVIIP